MLSQAFLQNKDGTLTHLLPRRHRLDPALVHCDHRLVMWAAEERLEDAMGVTGIGGFFFRAKDPDGLRAWYAEHLGVGSAPYGEWETQSGPSVFAPFAAETDHFPLDRAWMLNLRAEGLDLLCAKLRGAGIEVITRPEWDAPGVGRFARIQDPEGNPIELWEPDASA